MAYLEAADVIGAYRRRAGRTVDPYFKKRPGPRRPPGLPARRGSEAERLVADVLAADRACSGAGS